MTPKALRKEEALKYCALSQMQFNVAISKGFIRPMALTKNSFAIKDLDKLIELLSNYGNTENGWKMDGEGVGFQEEATLRLRQNGGRGKKEPAGNAGLEPLRPGDHTE